MGTKRELVKRIIKIYALIFGYFRVCQNSLQLYFSGFLIGVCLVIRGSEYLIFVSLLPLIHYLYQTKKISNKRVLIDFYIFGFIVCGFANLFLFQISSANWLIYLSGWFTFFATFVSWVLVCGFCSLSYLLMGAVLLKLKNNRHRLVVLPLLFAIAELLRSYLFAVMAYAPHGSLSPNFNWGSIAVPASGTGLVFSSRYIGFFGLTIFVVLVNISLYLIYTRKKILISFGILVVIFLTSYSGWNGANNSKADQLNIEVVHLSEKEDLATWPKNKWPKQGTDLLVMPEYSEFMENLEYKMILDRLSKKGIAVTSIKNGKSPEGTNQMIYINKKGEIIARQDKTFLIPTGETLPYVLQGVFKLIGKGNAVVDFTYTQQLSPGKDRESPVDTRLFKVGGLACSGVSALNEYSRLSDQGADVLVNSASLSFLKPNSLYHVYARNMARYHAVSNNKLFVQASRSGESYIIDSYGNIKTSTNL